MIAISEITVNNKKYTILNLVGGFAPRSIKEMKKTAEELLDTCKEITDEDIDYLEKEYLLKQDPEMYRFEFGERDKLWQEWGEYYLKKYHEKIEHQKKRKPKAGWVYLIQNNDNGLYKIGFTSDIKTRMKQLNHQYIDGIKEIAFLDSDDTYGDEKNIHAMFTSKKVKGEWYDLNQDDIEYFKNIQLIKE